MLALKPISLQEAADYSPWPKRLMGFEPWEKKSRNSQEILTEYNETWYKKALTLWETAFENQPQTRPLQFYAAFDEKIHQEVLQNAAIYGVTTDQHLFIVGNQLFLTSWNMLSALYFNLLLDVVKKYINSTKAATVVETGCGTGVNLFRLFEHLPLRKIIGGDICPNAVELCQRVTTKCQIPAQFFSYDYYGKQDLHAMTTDIEGSYILFTSHSIEQIQLADSSFIDQIQTLPNPPAVVIHFEPIIDAAHPDFLSQLHQLYAEKNNYNHDLLKTLKSHEAMGTLEILDYQKNVYGMCAFNPTSILAWRLC